MGERANTRRPPQHAIDAWRTLMAMYRKGIRGFCAGLALLFWLLPVISHAQTDGVRVEPASPLATASDRFFRNGSATLRYRDIEGGGTPVILLHGFALNLEVWNDLAAGLAES